MVQPDDNTIDIQIDNPYVGPRTFEEKDGRFFFGRERESRELLSLVISEPMVVFYSQSGAGKSSLINARLIPGLRDEGFHVLPVTRVSGELPEGIEDVENIFVYNLLLGLDQGRTEASELTHVSLSAYLQALDHDDLPHAEAGDGDDEAADDDSDAHEESTYHDYQEPARVLIIDQFEEVFTAHLNRWQDRKDFFRQLRQATKKDPYLWVVLTLREDYVANLDPYARILPGKLRARFYMERLGYQAAREVIEEPARQAGRPFASGVARALVDNLRQLQSGAGQSQTHLGEYVEPVQLQVVCYQLWENLKNRPASEITMQDLQELGDVDTALAQFYEQAIVKAVTKADVTEIELRNWFETKLITEAGTRGTVYQGPDSTEGMDNHVVDLLAGQFLLRPEIRAGGTWYELVHDRFVAPILQSNQSWGMKQPLIQLATAWAASGQNESRLLSGSQLAAALASKWQPLGPLVKEFLEASRETQEARARTLQAEEEARRQRELETAQQLAEEAEARRKAEAEQAREAEARAQEQAEAARKSRQQVSMLGILGIVAVALTIVAVYLYLDASQSARQAQSSAAEAQQSASLAITREAEAKANAELAATRAAEARANAELAATREAEAEANAELAATRQTEAQVASTAAIIQQNEALAQKEAAEAERNTVATLAANLEALITAQAYQEENTTATPTATATPNQTSVPDVAGDGPAETPTITPTATPNQAATVQAAQLQLSQLMALQTATAEAMRSQITADMVRIPTGPFLMGSLRDSSSLGANPQPQPNGDEFPQRSVVLPEFYIDQTEVTNESYGECVETGICPRQVGGDPNYHINASFNDHPALYVSWDSAQTYCTWRGKRLPTEAEWEKAARGTDGRVWSWGNSLRDSSGRIPANLVDGSQQPLKTGSFPQGASPYGALDMIGNVWEWTADWYKPTYYAERPEPDTSPPGPSQTDSTGLKVIRGGSFRSEGRDARTADRNGIGTGPSFDIGFRCAWSSP